MKLMEIFLILFLIFRRCSLKLTPVVADTKFLSTSRALLDLIDFYYVQQKHSFDIIIDQKLASSSNDLVDLLLSKSTCSSPYVIKSHELYSKIYRQIRESSIFFVETCYNLAIINHYYVLINAYPQKIQFLIYVHSCTFEDLNAHYNDIV